MMDWGEFPRISISRRAEASAGVESCPLLKTSMQIGYQSSRCSKDLKGSSSVGFPTKGRFPKPHQILWNMEYVL